MFFGRSEHVEALLSKLQRERFLAVVGTSGSGKSSLVLAGVLPRLDRGYRTSSGTSWRIATLRPGGDPIGHLATALQAARGQTDELAYEELGGAYDGRISGTRMQGYGAALERDLLLIELERSSNGLVEAVRSLELGHDENLLLVADQFEEIFRFHHLIQGQTRDAAAAFVKLLLRASEQRELPIYVMLTLRSDYLGECVEFSGLAEAISGGQYLVPLLNRDQRAEVIRGPVGVAGASISPALVQRLLNDAGDMTDQLPLLQHAMMRTFELAQAAGPEGAAVRIELAHYEAAGQMAGALSMHADQAYAEVQSKLGADGQRVTERLFRCLTEANEHGGGVRRPCKVAEVLAVTGCDLATLSAVVAAFVDPGRGFLVQQPAGELTAETTLDISHESLMRKWDRLRKWSHEEVALGRQLRALAEGAHELAAGTRGLLRDPELSLALKWRREQRVTAQDAERHGVSLEAVSTFLDASASAARRRALTLWAGIGAAFFGLALLSIKLQHSRREAERSAADATQARVVAEAAGGEAKRALSAARTASLVLAASDAQAQPALAAAYLRETSQVAADRGALWHDRAVSAARHRMAWKLEGHQQQLQSAAFSADGSRVVTAAQDGTARVWETDSGRLLATLETSVPMVSSASFSRDGRSVVTITEDRVPRVFVVATRRVAKLEGHQGFVTSAVFSRDGARVATSSWDKTARVWDAATGKMLAVLEGHKAEIESVSFSGDGKRLVSASADGSARIWDVASKQLVKSLDGHTGVVHAAEFSPDGASVVSAGEDGTARLWQAATGKPIRVLSGHTAPLASARFSADGRWIVTASADKTARVWDALTGEQKHTLTGHTESVGSAEFALADGRVITASWDGTARIWSGTTGNLLAVLAGHQGVVRAAISSDGQRIVTNGDDKFAWVWDGRTRESEGSRAQMMTTVLGPGGGRILTVSADVSASVWDSETGKVVTTITAPASLSFGMWSDDGRQVATGATDNRVRLWSSGTGELEAVLEGHRDGVTALAFSPDGNRVATASADKTARIWDRSTGRQLARLDGHDRGLTDISFDRAGSRIVTASWDETAKIWENAANGRCLFTLKDAGAPIMAAAFDPSGDNVVTASDNGAVALWNARTGALLHRLTGHGAAVRVAFFSPDGLSVVTASDDNTARIWNVSSGKLEHELKDHEGPVNDVGFSPDLRSIVTSSADGTARLWDRASGSLRGVLEGHLGSVRAATFSPDGSRVFTASADRSAGVWTASGDALRFVGGEGVQRRALLRGPAGHKRAEVWSDAQSRWIDARTVLWQESAFCQSKDDRVTALSESATEAERRNRRCRENVAACRNASVEDCERALARP